MFSPCNDSEDCNFTLCETFSCVHQLTSLVVLVSSREHCDCYTHNVCILNILLFWLPGIFDKFILFSSSGNVTFIQVDTSSYRACKKLQYPSTFRTAIQLFFIRTNNKRKHERGNINSLLRNRKKKAKQKV